MGTFCFFAFQSDGMIFSKQAGAPFFSFVGWAVPANHK
jgi:hypothetical protein